MARRPGYGSRHMSDVTTSGDEGGLLERSHERAVFSKAFERTAGGSGSLVVVTAGAGLGKSALLDDAARRAAGSGYRVLRAEGQPLEREYAFSVVLGLFDRVVAQLDGAGTERLFSGAAARARRLFQDGDVRGGFPVLHGLFWLTASLAEQGPLAIVVDDAQWADAASLRFLAYLASRIDEVPAVLVVAVRTGEDADDPALDAIIGQPGALVVHPAPLSPAAVAALVGILPADAGPAFAGEVHRMTNGNPLLVKEVLVDLASAAGHDTTDGGRDRPLSVGAALPTVERRLRRLASPAVRLADAAAILHEGAPLAVAARVADLSIRVARSAAADLRAAAILGDTDPVRFTHPVVRDTVVAGIGDRAGALHARAADALAGADAPPDVVAPHLVAAPPGGSAAAVAILCRVARRALRAGQPAPAVSYLRRALAEPPSPDDRAELLAALAEAEAAAGDGAWHDHLEEAVRAEPDGDRRAGRREPVARVLYNAGRLGEAADLFDAALRDLGGGDGGTRSLRLLTGLAQATLVDVTRRAATVDLVEAALGGSTAADTPERRALLGYLAYAKSIAGEARREVVDLAGRALDPDVISDIEVAGGISFFPATLALLFADAGDELDAVLDRASAVADRTGHPGLFAAVANTRAALNRNRGNIAEAVTDGNESRRAAGLGANIILPGIAANLADALLEQGDAARARTVLELPDDGIPYSDGASYNTWLWARGRVRMASGDVPRALNDFLECRRRQEQMGASNPATIHWPFDAAVALAQLDRRGEAERVLGEALTAARRFGAPRTLAAALRTGAHLARGDERIALLDEAIVVVDGTPWTLELMKGLLDLGTTLVDVGRAADAVPPLRRALELAHRGGALAVEQQALRLLRAAGVRPRRFASTGVEALTPAERRVAQLAADGLTNREIAEARFVTVKAVEYHLANIYRKLGITSRSQVAETLPSAVREAANR